MGSFVQWAGDLLDQVDVKAQQRLTHEEESSPRPVQPVPASGAGAPAPARGAEGGGGSELAVLRNEVDSLRAVWLETRTNLQKAKELLRKREEKHEQILSTQLDTQRMAFESQISSLRESMAENQSEFELALSAKNDVAMQNDRMMQNLQNKMKSDQTLQDKLYADIESLKEEREKLLQEQKEANENHSRMISSLRDEYLAQQKVLDQESSFQNDTFEQIKMRESTLEADNMEYANALASAQRQMEAIQLQIKRIEAEKKWLEADKQVLQDEMKSFQNSAQAEKQQLEDQVVLLKSQHDSSIQALQAMSQELKEVTMERDGALESMRGLRIQLVEQKKSLNLQAKLKQMEADKKHLTDQVLEKQNSIETLTAERNSFRFRYENELKRSQILENEQKLPKARADGFQDIENGFTGTSGLRARGAQKRWDDFDDDYRYTGGKFKAFPKHRLRNPTLSRAVLALDRFGAEMSLFIRSRPIWRIIIVLYIISLHVWVLYVIHHFGHH